jgi:hypothetical protein
MNPGFADFNVDLTGVITGSTYQGTWTFSTLHGLTNHGTFAAVKQ